MSTKFTICGKPRDQENDPHVRWPTVSASSSPRLWIPFRVPFSPVLLQTSHVNRDMFYDNHSVCLASQLTMLNRNTPLPTTESEDNLTLMSKVLLVASMQRSLHYQYVPVAGVVLIMMRKCFTFLETNLVFSNVQPSNLSLLG